MTNYKVKCDVKIHGELIPIMEEVESENFEEAVEKVVNHLVDTMGVSPFDINNFEIGDL